MEVPLLRHCYLGKCHSSVNLAAEATPANFIFMWYVYDELTVHNAQPERNMNLNDVVIHVNETLDARARHDLEERMREIEGVISPRFSESASHLMVVAYNADRMRTQDLLEAVRRQGYTAQSCGGI